MQSDQVGQFFRIGQRVRTTDTHLRAEILEMSVGVPSMAFLRFENGEEKWWTMLSLADDEWGG